MLNDYLSTFQSQEPKLDIPIQPSFWDQYLDKLLKHLVIEFSFDFMKISESLSNLDYQKLRNVKLNADIIRNRWTYLHFQRKKEKEKKKMSQNENNQNLFNSLMKKLEEQKVDDNIPFEYFQNDEKPSGSNINRYFISSLLIFRF